MRRLLVSSVLGLALAALGIGLAVRGSGSEERAASVAAERGPATSGPPAAPRNATDLAATELEPARAPAAGSSGSVESAATRARRARRDGEPGVRVHVVGADGEPVEGLELRATAKRYTLLTARTDADGNATLRAEDSSSPSFSASLARAIRDSKRTADSPAELRAVAFLRDEIAIPFDPDDPEQPPIEVRLPPTGPLDVRFVTDDGRAFPILNGRLHVTRVVSPEALASATSFPFGGASMRVDFVEIDQRLHLSAEIHGVLVGGPEVDGPSRAGERAEAIFAIDSGLRVAAGRVVGADGKPVGTGKGFGDRPASTSWIATLESATERRRVQAAFVTADPDGRFAVPIHAEELDFGPTVLALASASGDRIARGRLPAELPTGRIELGDLIVEPAPILVAGVVRDAEGAPIPLARVGVGERARVNQRDATRGGDTAGTDREGAFTIRRQADDDAPLDVFANHADFWQAEPVRVPPGSTGVEITLERRGALGVRALASRALRVGGVRVRARPVAPSSDDHSTGAWRTPPGAAVMSSSLDWANDVRIADWTDQGDHIELSWTLEHLPPGPTYVELLYADSGERLAAFDDVLVESGGVTRDPRLDPIDLRLLLREHDLTFRRADGSPVIPDVVRWRPNTRGPLDEWNDVDRVGGDSIRVTTPTPVIDVLVGGAGCRTRLVEGISGSQTIELERGVPVRFVLPGGGGETLLVRGSGSAWTPRTSLRLDNDGAATGELDPGRTSVWISKPTGGAPLTVEEILVYDVPPGGPPQEIVLERLARALAEEGARR